MISNIGASPMTNSFASRIDMRGFTLPAFPSLIPTRGQSNLSDEEFDEKIMDLARRSFAAQEDFFFSHTSGNSELNYLRRDFVSVVSPDRVGIINNTLASLADKISSLIMRLRPNRSMNLLEILFQNSHLFGSENIGGNFIRFTDSSGNEIASFSSNGIGWSSVPTDAENSRHHNFNARWRAAFKRAGAEYVHSFDAIERKLNGETVDVAAWKERGVPLNMAKLATHGITIDSETGETVVDKNLLNNRALNQSRVWREIVADRYTQMLAGGR